MSDARRIVKNLVLEALREKRGALIVVAIALLVVMASQSLLLFLLGPLFQAIFGALGQTTVTVSELVPPQVRDYFPILATWQLPQQKIIQVLPLALVVLAAVRGYGNYLFQFKQQAVTLHVGNRYRNRLFSAVLSLDFESLGKRSPGEWMSLVMNDVAYLQARAADLLTGLIKDGTVVISALITLFFVHWPSAIAVLLFSIPLMISTGRTGRRISRFAESWQRGQAGMASSILEMRKRFEFIRAQEGEALERAEFGRMNRTYFDNIVRTILTRSAFAPALELAGFIGFVLLLVAIYKGVMGFDFETGGLFILLGSVGAIVRPLRSIGEQLSRWHETRGILRRSFETFEALAAQEKGPARAQAESIERLVIEKLQLDYGEGFVLKAQDLRVQAGESIVIIGPSGGGKSTLLKCLAGLKQPTLWKASSTWESVRRSASLVSQKPFLFSGSVRDNLNYGLPARDDAELRDALAAVGLLGELEAGSQGLDTELDFVQSPLSGGQMQRLTVARGLLRPHALLLMDEVTSAIDPAAEEILTKHIVAEGRRQKRLLFYVTHRLSQLDLFDQIWFCEKGEVFVYASLKDAQNHERLRRFLSEHSEG